MNNHAARIKQEASERGPTPETRSKLCEDQLMRLYGTGVIDERQFSAGMEIREIADFLMAMHFRAVKNNAAVDGGSRSFHPLDGIPEQVKANYDAHYLPWKAWANNTHSHGHSLTELTYRVVVDSNDPPVTVLPDLVRSLEKYADFQEGG